MATINIPDRICPHCGETRWVEMKYKRAKTNDIRVSYYCAKELNESTKLYHKTSEGKISMTKARRTQIKKLKDHYILDNIATQLRNQGIKLDRKSVTQEQIEMYRQSLLTQRLLKQLKYESKQTIN